MAHAKARLTEFGRLLLVQRITELGWPPAYWILRRHGLSRLAHTDRASGAVVRYQREHPGELVHIEVKKLGRIPDGSGHRIHGRSATTHRSRDRL